MTVEQIRKQLSDRRLHMVSEATGLHVNTIRKIRDGKTEDVKHATFDKLAAYLEGGK